MALADIMRLSLRERRTRGFFLCCVAGNPGETATCAAFIEDPDFLWSLLESMSLMRLSAKKAA
jgi:hypothetical protein